MSVYHQREYRLSVGSEDLLLLLRWMSLLSVGMNQTGSMWLLLATKWALTTSACYPTQGDSPPLNYDARWTSRPWLDQMLSLMMDQWCLEQCTLEYQEKTSHTPSLWLWSRASLSPPPQTKTNCLISLFASIPIKQINFQGHLNSLEMCTNADIIASTVL